MPAERFPLQEAMSFGFGVLRLSPSAFWSMTPLELAAAVNGLTPKHKEPIGKSELTQLMRRFPDQENLKNDG